MHNNAKNNLKQYKMKDFRVAAVSKNTNSFGLHQMIVVAKDGETYKTLASMYNVKKEKETITMVDGMFRGCECTEKTVKVPKEVINLIWN